MIETITRIALSLHPMNNFQVSIPEVFLFNVKYNIALLVSPPTSNAEEVQTDSEITIRQIYGDNPIIYRKKFYSEMIDDFSRNKDSNSNFNITDENLLELCLFTLKVLEPKKKFYILNLDISCLNKVLIESLKTTKEHINHLMNIGDLYLYGNFRQTIIEVGKFGEYLTRQFVKKLKKKYSTFKSGVDCLSNHRPKGNSRINYNFIGNMLYPIYYFRNQASHPEPEISLDKTTALVSLENLSYILRYISINQIKF